MSRIHRLVFLIGLCGLGSVCMPSETEGAALEGRVLDGTTGLPMEGVSVRLEGKLQAWGGPPLPILTGEDGRFAFTGLAAATETGYGYIAVANKDGFYNANSGLLQVEEGETRKADLILERRIRVFVRVSGPGGGAIAGASALICIQGEPYMQYLSRTDGDGTWHAGEYRRGPMQLTAAKAGYRSSVTPAQLTGQSEAETLSVMLEPDQPATNRTLHGTMSRRGGGAASGATFLFNCDAGAEAWLYTTAGADGSYTLETIPGACISGVVRDLQGTQSAVQLTGADTRFDFESGDIPLQAGRPGVKVVWHNASERRGALLRIPIPGGRGDIDFLGRRRALDPSEAAGPQP